jgi:uncharacterized protein (TIGR04255 family)
MDYNKAPIKEAVLDIKVDRLNISDINELIGLQEIVAQDFPEVKKKHNIIGSFHLSTDKPIQGKSHSDLSGFIFLSRDNYRQLQVGIDGFTLNILKPYESWESHFDLFMKYWADYNNKFRPSNILKIAVRYINRIEIPFPLDNFQDYITNMPPIPDCLPQSFSNFIMQIQVPCNDGFRSAVITETIEPIENEVLPFILDIGVSQDLNVNNSFESLVKNFSEIRSIKNEIFENCITEKTRNLFS